MITTRRFVHEAVNGRQTTMNAVGSVEAARKPAWREQGLQLWAQGWWKVNRDTNPARESCLALIWRRAAVLG